MLYINSIHKHIIRRQLTKSCLKKAFYFVFAVILNEKKKKHFTAVVQCSYIMGHFRKIQNKNYVIAFNINIKSVMSL